MTFQDFPDNAIISLIFQALNMKLHELLKPDRILLDFSASNREDVINCLVDLLVDAGAIENPESAKKAVIEREHEVGTGIGYGVAIPHAEPGPFPAPLAALTRLNKGINFHSPDNDKARLIFLLLTPDKTPALHVRLLARICRLLRSDALRKTLLEAEDVETVARAISESEADYPELMP